MNEKFCDTAGHDYAPRYQQDYIIPKNDDWPIAMTGAAGIAFFISIVVGGLNAIPWVIIPTSAGVILSLIIFCAARFRSTYLFDICKRCGDKKKL